MRYDRFCVVDWSAAKGRRSGKDSIWLCDRRITGVTIRNLPHRTAAENMLAEICAYALEHNERLLICVDVAFGAPAGLARAITGQADALSWWRWLETRVVETEDHGSNYREIAAEMNACFSGEGPFWGNGARADIPGLPRKKPKLPAGLVQHREAELQGHEHGLRPKPIWQLAGAGAVGAQSLTAIPILERLRKRFAGKVSVWPFEPIGEASIVCAEIYLSLLQPQVAEAVSNGEVPDRAQVRLHAEALARMQETIGLERLFEPNGKPSALAEEGWYLGAGQAQLFRSVF